MTPIRLAIADDSIFVRKAIRRVLEQVSTVELVGAAASGEELLDHIAAWRPDVVTLDLSMPGMGGLNTLDRLMIQHPVPVIILSTHSSKDAPLTLEALSRGAVDFIDKQEHSLVDFDALRSVLLEKVQQVVLAHPAPHPPHGEAAVRAAARREHPEAPGQNFDVLLIGASTGGPPAIQQILEDLEGELPLPAAVVQHMPAGFTRAFAERLDAHLPFPVREAAHGDPLARGTVYIGPSGSHLKFQREGDCVLLVLDHAPEHLPHKPSVDVLFSSGAALFGSRVLAVLLTGMGKDGAEGMEALARAGAYTLAQDEPSSVIYGMPRAAVLAGAVREELPLLRIGSRIGELMGRERPA